MNASNSDGAGGGETLWWRDGAEEACGGWALNRTEYLDLTQVDVVRSAIAAAYALVAALGVGGNVALICIILSRRYLHTASNWFLLNLSVADLLAAAGAPLKLLELCAECDTVAAFWQLTPVCPAVYYLMPLVVFAGELTLVAIACERYMVIVHPLSRLASAERPARTFRAIAFAWLAPAICCAPFLLYRSAQPMLLDAGPLLEHSAAVELLATAGLVSRSNGTFRGLHVRAKRVLCLPQLELVDSLVAYAFGVTAPGATHTVFSAVLLLLFFALPTVVITATSVCIAVHLYRSRTLQSPSTRERTSSVRTAVSEAASASGSRAASLRRVVSPAAAATEGHRISARVTAQHQHVPTSGVHKRRVARMMLLVSFSFTLCWTPFYALSAFQMFNEQLFESQHFFSSYLLVHWCGFVHSALNPLICFAMSQRFRRAFLQLLLWPPARVLRLRRARIALGRLVRLEAVDSRRSLALQRPRSWSVCDSFSHATTSPPVDWDTVERYATICSQAPATLSTTAAVEHFCRHADTLVACRVATRAPSLRARSRRAIGARDTLPPNVTFEDTPKLQPKLLADSTLVRDSPK